MSFLNFSLFDVQKTSQAAASIPLERAFDILKELEGKSDTVTWPAGGVCFRARFRMDSWTVCTLESVWRNVAKGEPDMSWYQYLIWYLWNKHFGIWGMYLHLYALVLFPFLTFGQVHWLRRPTCSVYLASTPRSKTPQVMWRPDAAGCLVVLLEDFRILWGCLEAFTRYYVLILIAQDSRTRFRSAWEAETF